MRCDAKQAGSQFVPRVIITRDMAKALFGDDDAVGKTVYDGLGQSATVVGVIEHMLGAWVDWDKLDAGHAVHPRRSAAGRSCAMSSAPSPAGAMR